MAYYEMMPAGLPAGLQAGMDSVLNKKFGTSTSYAPGTWPNTVNLMGPLPEKTIVSSPIADFSDGADDVPTKSLIVTIAPTLSGVSTITETQTGRNLLNYADISASYRVTSITENGSGSFTVVASGLGAYIDHVIKVKAGQAYTIKCTSATNDEGNATQIGVVNVYDGSDDTANLLLNGASISYSQKVFTPTGNYILVRNKVTGGAGSGTGTIVKPQLESGSITHAYEPYTAPTTYTAQLGRTVYGGMADIVNGEGTDENGNDFTFTGQEIPTKLGYNAFWSDEGDTEVTYRADINLALQALSGNRGLMMARPQLEPETEPEETIEETPEDMER